MNNNQIAENTVYTDRVMRGSDGVYRWQCKLSKEQSRVFFRLILKIGAIVATVILVILLAILSTLDDFPLISFYTLGLIAFMYGMLVGLPAILGASLQDRDIRKYEMDEETIRHKHALKGGGDAVVFFKKLKWVQTKGNMLRMKEGITTYSVFVPEEDFEFVVNFVRSKAGIEKFTVF